MTRLLTTPMEQAALARPSTYACDNRRSCYDSPGPSAASSGCQRREREGQRGVKNHSVSRDPKRLSHTTTRVFGVGIVHARQRRVHFVTLEKSSRHCPVCGVFLSGTNTRRAPVPLEEVTT